MPSIVVVRHGEVFNPNHVVYADLPGFDLSPVGVRQAHQLGGYLAQFRIDIVLSSPLARARHTASAISSRHDGITVTVDPRLTETRMYPGWTGMTWADVERCFPHQFQGYLADATRLEDVTESVVDVANRMTACVRDAIDDGYTTIVVVGHQDPSQALRLRLVGRPLSELRHDPPEHASATTITTRDGRGFAETSTWKPENLDL
jgi:probable phosphoglycerate mutase